MYICFYGKKCTYVIQYLCTFVFIYLLSCLLIYLCNYLSKLEMNTNVEIITQLTRLITLLQEPAVCPQLGKTCRYVYVGITTMGEVGKTLCMYFDSLSPYLSIYLSITSFYL